MHIILGIGNPGPEYANTRHNVGWMILDHLLPAGSSFGKTKWPLTMAEWQHPQAGKVLLVKPTTYVNRSGQAAQALAAFYKISPSDMLVISDDIHLALGTLRLRKDGSHGGHNGLRDLIAHLGPAFPRLRFGVGKPLPGADQINHVLGPFRPDEQDDLHLGLRKAAECVERWLVDGVERAMTCNGPLHPPPPKVKTPVAKPEPETAAEALPDHPTDGSE